MAEKSDSTISRGPPPPLPPRAPTSQSTPQAPHHEPPPAYDSIFADSARDGIASLAANDPRTSSTQSLVPTKSNEDTDRRRLLLIFIHGFMGDETSFQSFPAHVHSLVAALVSESHIVHTKIYPRYRSRKNIQFARDDFSRWLGPHEGPKTDVVLLGHSMGGLVSAEVAVSQIPADHSFRHRLLGTINFDVPFLGMHPSVIKSGLASIFSPAPESSKPQTEAASYMSAGTGNAAAEIGNASTAGPAKSTPPALPPRRTDTLFHPQRVDPNYNPAFENDVRLPVRKGWRNAWHFVSKHNQDLIDATKQLVKSHMEFGGAMADYSGLKNRYCRIRALEESDPNIRKSIVGSYESPPRVRFVNYYTSSTGRPKKPKSQSASPALAPIASPAPTPSILSDEQFVEPTTTPAAIATEASLHDSQPEPRTEVAEHASEVSALKIDDHDDEDDDGESAYDLEESNQALHDPMDMLDPLPMSDDGVDMSDAESWADAMEDLELNRTKSSVDESPIPASLSATEQEQPGESSNAIDNSSHTLPGNASKPSLTTVTSSINDSSLSLSTTATLPPIPELPSAPPEPDLSIYVGKESRKLAERDYSRAVKTYERAVKDRNRAIRDREKLEEKRQRNMLKESKRAEKEAEKDAKRKEREQELETKKKEKVEESAHERAFELQRRETEREWKETLAMKWNEEDGTVTPMPSSSASAKNSNPSPKLTPSTSLTTAPSLSSFQTTRDSGERAEKPRKEHTFCMLPPKDSSGNRDPVWVKVFMPNVDEVGAHCGLFFETSPAYEQLVGDVGERITEWVSESVSEMVAGELEEQ